MTLRVLLVLAALSSSGCVSLEKGVFLTKGTPVQVVDASKSPIFSGFVATEFKPVIQRLIENTRAQLRERNIQTVAEPTPGAAILKYDIRTLSQRYKVMITYRATLETPDGKIVFDEGDDKKEASLDELLSDLATRMARAVSRSVAK